MDDEEDNIKHDIEDLEKEANEKKAGSEEEQKTAEQLKIDIDNRKKELEVLTLNKIARMIVEKTRLINVKKQMEKIEAELKKIHPMIKEVNKMTQTLHRKVFFTIKIEKVIDQATNQATGRVIPIILVRNSEVNYSYEWTVDKFEQRYFLIKEYMDDYLDDGIL
jgi:hypothetical protein